MMVNPVSQPRFLFIGMSVIGLAVGLGRAEGLVIGGAVLMGANVTTGFSGLFL